ncbi:MAG: hypothetical protein IJ087_01580 [Eggerthellaceae bacterium]|nr:hypothetical protein [Eggerthellaceae bacterium]
MSEPEWLTEAKERVELEVENFCRLMICTAEELQVEEQWFVEQCMNKLHWRFSQWRNGKRNQLTNGE